MSDNHPKWANEWSWKFDNKSDEWMLGYVEANDGICYNGNCDTIDVYYYYSAAYCDIIFVDLHDEEATE